MPSSISPLNPLEKAAVAIITYIVINYSRHLIVKTQFKLSLALRLRPITKKQEGVSQKTWKLYSVMVLIYGDCLVILHNHVIMKVFFVTLLLSRALKGDGFKTLWDLLLTTTEAKADSSPLEFIAETRYCAVSSKSHLKEESIRWSMSMIRTFFPWRISVYSSLPLHQPPPSQPCK